jgi:hypothetical protein
MRLVIGVKRPAADYGVLFHSSIVLELARVTSGQHTRLLFPKISMKRVGKKRAKQHMLSALPIHFAND